MADHGQRAYDDRRTLSWAGFPDLFEPRFRLEQRLWTCLGAAFPGLAMPWNGSFWLGPGEMPFREIRVPVEAKR